MSASVFKVQATGNGAIELSLTVPSGYTYQIHSVFTRFDTAPTTGGNQTITLNDSRGSVYDTVVDTADATAGANIEYYPGGTMYLKGGDSLDVAYANPDSRTYGVTITAERVV